MMIFLSTLWLIVKFHFFYAVHRVAKLIQETFSICIPVCLNVLAEEMKNMAVDPLPHFQLLKHKPVIFRLIFRRTLFPLQMDKFFWRQIYFIKEFARR